MSPLAAPDPDLIRSAILSAADARFLQYGYGKTTMAEIARDCGMSAANLYRYFDNKADIAAALACDCLDRRLDLLKQIVDDVATPGPERVTQWIVVSFEETWRQWSETPRMNELVDHICSSRPDIVRDHYDAKRTMLTQLLQDATARGELAVTDPEDTAAAVLTACISFDVPHFMHMCSFDQHKAKAEQLARTLVSGMQAGGGAA